MLVDQFDKRTIEQPSGYSFTLTQRHKPGFSVSVRSLCLVIVTLVQVSVSGLHCRMSLTMVALPFSTAQYSAVLLSCTHTDRHHTLHALR